SNYDSLFIAIILALASLIIIRHKDNIARIKNKTENLVPWGLNLTHQDPKK
ncbi:glycerol-3-phosphate acyltransferase, partial [Streptococcus pneumoniae]|nr:glycerol-3-phosphate acyltransferase [Streptococcus pneumoniae]